MIDGESTTYDWQRDANDVCILPIGSFEQHGHHLPVATDNILVSHIARYVAEQLPACLLDTLPYGTALEHSGYRGSITLRPETLMTLVRDIADACERQGFRILILLNGHGGNFSLLPVARDINRLDGGLKIILTDWYGFRKVDGTAPPSGSGEDFHAGCGETSVMLAVRPELVGDERHDRPEPEGEHPLTRSDLTTFGVGHIAPSGAAGYPSRATRELGERQLAAAKERIIPWLRDRIRRLRENPRYGPPDR